MTDPAPVREGDLLAGKYRVERVLGSGGMGVVVAAMHEQLEQRVAIKFVRDEALGNTDAVERFLREARAAVKLKSEHAAQGARRGHLESGAPYMVMEYLEGGDLSQVLEERGRLRVETAAEYIVQACEAIAEAHAAGIIHRDIKPQNLFLAKSVGGGGKIKVLDFGVSKSMVTSGAGGLTQTRSMLGSPLYMSPEQMRSSRDVDARADVWALGVVLYELLTQRWPFEAESMPELCLKVVSEQPTPITTYRPDVPPAVVEVITRCLQRDPNQRYAHAAELATALEAFAPPASRIIAERARLAVSMKGSQVSSPSISIESQPGTDVLARTAATPAAWDSTKESSPIAPATKKPNRTGLWIGIGAGVVAVGVGAMLLRGHGQGPPVAPLPATAAIVAPPMPSPTVLAPPAPSPATSDSAPVASATPVTPDALASGGPARVAPAIAPALPAKPPAPPRVPGTGKHGGDDDIPSLR